MDLSMASQSEKRLPGSLDKLDELEVWLQQHPAAR